MLATENTARLLTRVILIAQAADEVEAAGRGIDWLPGIRSALQRIQLECADLTYALHELRTALPSSETLQPRLLD